MLLAISQNARKTRSLSNFGTVVQLVITSDCGSEGREFESHYLHKKFFDNWGRTVSIGRLNY